MDRPLLIATLVILLSSAFIGVNLVYAPKSAQLQGFEQALKEEEELGRLSNDLLFTEKRVETYRNRLMEKGGEEEQLIDRIREIANEVPVRVISIIPLSAQKGVRGPSFVSLRVLFEGSYHQLGTFISKVENSEKFIRVGGIEFAVPAGKTSQPIVYEVEVSTLRYF